MSINISENVTANRSKELFINPSEIMQKYLVLLMVILSECNYSKKREINNKLSSIIHNLKSMFKDIDKSIQKMKLPKGSSFYGINNNLKSIINPYLEKICKNYSISITRSNGEEINGKIYIGITNCHKDKKCIPALLVKNGTIIYFPIREIKEIKVLSKRNNY